MTTLVYREDKQFFEALDRHVEANEAVTILLGEQRPDKDSGLWRRLARCQNWGEIDAQLRDPIARHRSAMSGAIPMLTGGELALLAWLGSLLIGLLFYAAYKNMRIKVRGGVGDKEIEIELAPA